MASRVERSMARVVGGIWILGLVIAGCRPAGRPTPPAAPFGDLPFQRIWQESFPAAWSGWAPRALACARAGEEAGECLQALRPTLAEQVTEEAARRKEALGITAPYVASIVGGYAQRPELAAALLVLAMAESAEEGHRARLQAAFEAVPRRFEAFAPPIRSSVFPLPHPEAGEEPRRWAQYYLSQEWALLRAAVAAWRPPAAEEIGCADLVAGEDLCARMARVRSPTEGAALEARLEEFFRGAFDYADAFARSERFLQKDPAGVRAALSAMVGEAREQLMPLEREAARRRLAGERVASDPLEAAWDEVERRLFGPAPPATR